MREYDFTISTWPSVTRTKRCAFLMPKWYVKKYGILHWDNRHMKSGEIWEQHFARKNGQDILKYLTLEEIKQEIEFQKEFNA